MFTNKIISILLLAVTTAISATALPRIKIYNNRFIKSDSGETFTPRGFNYARLRPLTPGSLAHSTFDPIYYNISDIEAMFLDLKTNNFNFVRVFIDTIAPLGLFETNNATRFSPIYMTNVIDFLQRANYHEIYVNFTFSMWGPAAGIWFYTGPTSQPKVTGPNLQYFREGAAKTRAAMLSEFAAAIKSSAPNLLPTVLAYEIQNELCYFMDYEPLSLNSGTFTYNGETFDLSSEKDLQKLMDAQTINLCNHCVTEVKKIDPEAFVTISLFTFNAVGRTGPVYLESDTTSDVRVPARPLALTQSKLDYIDIHIYPHTATSVQDDLLSINFEEVKKDCPRTGKPLLLGEFGAFSNNFPVLSNAATEMADFAKKSFQRNFDGWGYWTYDCDEQETLWNGKSENSEILVALINITNSTKYFNTFLTDNFNVTGNGDINFDNSGGRQSGTLSPYSYTIGSGVTTVNDSGPFAGKCRLQSQTMVGLTENFTNSFILELELKVNTLNSNYWTGICFGKDGTLWEPWKPSGMSIIFRDSGTFTVLDNNVNIADFPYSQSLEQKIKICVTQSKVGEDALVSIFLNGNPIVIDASDNSTVFNHSAGFSNNYITIMAYGANADSAIDNLKISIPEDSGPEISPWTGDSDSEVSNSKSYSHAINFTTETDVFINDLFFEGVGTATAGTGWALSSPSNSFANFYLNNKLSGDSSLLGTGAVYSTDISCSLVLSNLNPVGIYELTLFGAGYDTNNRVYLSGSDGGEIRDFGLARYGLENGQKIKYEYKPDTNGTFTITSTTVLNSGTNTWAWFGFSNEIIAGIPEPATSIIFTIFFLIFCYKKSCQII